MPTLRLTELPSAMQIQQPAVNADGLYSQIGQLKVENDFLKKG